MTISSNPPPMGPPGGPMHTHELSSWQNEYSTGLASTFRNSSIPYVEEYVEAALEDLDGSISAIHDVLKNRPNLSAENRDKLIKHLGNAEQVVTATNRFDRELTAAPTLSPDLAERAVTCLVDAHSFVWSCNTILENMFGVREGIALQLRHSRQE